MELGARECPHCKQKGVEQRYYYDKENDITYRYCMNCNHVFHYLKDKLMFIDHNISVEIIKRYSPDNAYIPLLKLSKYMISLEFLPMNGIPILLSIWSMVLSMTIDILIFKVIIVFIFVMSIINLGKSLSDIVNFKITYSQLTKGMSRMQKKEILKTLIGNTFLEDDINVRYYINLIEIYLNSKSKCINSKVTHTFS